MRKRIACIVFCLLMVASVFAGCGDKGADMSKEVTLKWVIQQGEQKDANEVLGLINDKLGELLPNTKLEFVWEPNMASKWSMWMAAKTKYDLAWTGYTFDMMSECLNDSYTDLTDLVEEYGPNIQEEMKEFEKAYTSSKVDGRLYAIPNVQPILHQSNWLGIDAKFWPYFPVDEFLQECHNNPKTTEKVYQLYEQFWSI